MNLEARNIRRLIRDARRSPFFRRKLENFTGRGISHLNAWSEKIPPVRLEELVAEKLQSGDPYSSRWCGGQTPLAVFQLDYDAESALYLPLDRSTLEIYAEALRRCWSLLGLRKRDAVAIFDYGTSPLSYLASSLFTPYLKRGAADALECLAICNDGTANMSQRAVEILKFVRPRILFVRADCLQPLATEVEAQRLRLSDYTHALVVSENEGVLSKADQKACQQRLGLPIYRLLRVDIAMFLAVECPECRLFHSWKDFYRIESRDDGPVEEPGSASGGGWLMITNWFARSCPVIRYVSQVRGSMEPSGCPRRPRDLRIAA